METSGEQLFRASQLADLVGELLDKYIDAAGSVISETSGDLLADEEQLLQEVDRYRGRSTALVCLEPNTEQRDELAEKVKAWRELSDE